MSICFVTSFYTLDDLDAELELDRKVNESGTLISRYQYSLLSLLDSDAFFVIFVSSRTHASLKLFLSSNVERNNYMLVIQEPKDFWAYDSYSKSRHLFTMYDGVHYNNRKSGLYYPLVLSKADMITKASQLVEHEHLFWIDAGLASPQLFPTRHRKYGSRPENRIPQVPEPVQFDEEIITFMGKPFHDRLSSIMQECELFFMANAGGPFWPWRFPEELAKNPDNPHHYVIGGLWGGKRDRITEFCAIYLEYLERAFYLLQKHPNHDVFTDETILEAVVSDLMGVENNGIRLDNFNVWVSEDDWSFDIEPSKDLVFFYQMLTGEESFDENGLMWSYHRSYYNRVVKGLT